MKTAVEVVGLFCSLELLGMMGWLFCNSLLSLTGDFLSHQFHLPSGLVYIVASLWDFILTLFSYLLYLCSLHEDSCPFCMQFHGLGSLHGSVCETPLLWSRYSGAGGITLSYPCGCQHIFKDINRFSYVSSSAFAHLQKNQSLLKVGLEVFSNTNRTIQPARGMAKFMQFLGKVCMSNLSLRSSFGI